MEQTATISPGAFLIILAVTVLISLIAGYAARIFEERQKPEAPPASAPETAQPVQSEEHTALRVMLDKNLAWNLEVDGARLAPNELTPEQRARLVNIIVQIRPWIDGKIAPISTVPVPAPAPVPPPLVAVPVSTKPQPPADSSNIGTRNDKDKNKLDLGRGFRSLMANDMKVMENTRPPSIVTMIDDFLQKRLTASPLANREIHLEEGSLGEVIVFVGKTRYAGVDDVPDPEIQTMIKSAIKDWEKSA